MSSRNNRSLLACGLCIIILGASLATGCSRQARYEVLTFFFTGVPPLDQAGQDSEAETPEKEAEPVGLARVEKKTGPPPLIKHAPFQEGNCNACHEFGQSNLLFNEPQELCFRCHEDFAQSFPWVHGPVAVGFCNTCHEPHESENEFLLISTSQDICFTCHLKQDILNTAYHTSAGESSCTDCHDPHGGADRWFLREEDAPLASKPLEIGKMQRKPGIYAESVAGYGASETGRENPGA